MLAEDIVTSLDDEGHAARYVAGIRILRDRVWGVHFLGGGYMNASWQENLARIALAPWASRRGITVIGTGLGLTPLDDEALAFVRKCVGAFDLLGVRDRGTRDALEGLPNVSLVPDDVFVNGLEGCYSEDSDLPDIMVCVQGDLVEDVRALHSHVLSILNSWSVSPERTIGVVECNPYIDYPIFETLERAGFSCRLYPFAYLWSDGFPARKGQMWVSTRYHPHLLAAARGCRGCFIPLGSRYYDDKHKAALRMGSSWTEAPMGREIPDPGEGFSDSDIRWDYQRVVRDAVRLLYGVS